LRARLEHARNRGVSCACALGHSAKEYLHVSLAPPRLRGGSTTARRHGVQFPPSRRVPAPRYQAAIGLVRLHCWPPPGFHRCEARPGGLVLPPRNVPWTGGRAVARSRRARAWRGGGVGSRAESEAWGGTYHSLHAVDVGPSRRWRLVSADGRAAVAPPDQCCRPWDGACPRGDRCGTGPCLGLQLARPTGHGRGW
jgi:hypothetical protein